MIATILVGALIVVESYYWFVYVPRAWKNPGTNREIDDIRHVTFWFRRRCSLRDGPKDHSR
jgi:hypothetical protein